MTSDDIKRLNFYEKQFLGTRDFQDEQAYHIEMRRRHLIAHHLWGIVAGLEITQDIISKIWYVQPGMAIDGFGREIIVFDPEPLNINKIADQLAGAPKPALLKVWIAYQIEKTNRPAPGYEVCGGNGQFMRTHETFRLIYQDDPPFAVKKPEKPENWPRPYEDLPDDPKQKPWPVYLGTIIWNKDSSDPTKKVIESVDLTGRHYVGNITTEVLAPAGELLIRDRNAPHPLPTDPNDPHYGGVKAKLEGSLEVDRLLEVNQEAHIQGKVGIGTTDPDTKLQVLGGTDATLENGGYVVIGSVSSKNMVLDDHGIMARNNTDKAELQLQSKGGDLVVHKDQAGSELVVKDSGYVGIGTTTPMAKLHVQQGDILLKADADDPGDIIFQNSAGIQKARIWSDLDAGVNKLHLSSADNTPDITIDAAGNVGIGTTNPASKLDVRGPSDAHTAVFSSNPPSANPLPNQLTLMGSGTNSEARLGFGTTFPDGSGHHTAIIKTVVPSNGGGDLVFQTREPGFGNITERMRITNDGDTLIKRNLTVGAGGNGVIKVRHIDGKDYQSDNPDTLYLNWDTGKDVQIGQPNKQSSLKIYGALAASNLFAGLPFRIGGGKTTPGVTNWLAYPGPGNGIYLDIDTSAAGFTATPLYFTSLHGDSKHWATTGGTSIYSPTPTGFRVYVRWPDGGSLTPQHANQNKWHIQWFGIQFG